MTRIVRAGQEQAMFRVAVFHLTKPICNCEEQNLAWWIEKDKNEFAKLVFSCKTCDTRLCVPPEQFKAYLEFDMPYPGKQKGSGKAAKKDGQDEEWGKVIPFRPKKNSTVVPFRPKK